MAKKSKYTKEERKAMIDGLEKAARLLKRKEWIQGAEVEYKLDDNGNETEIPQGFCAIGALEHVGAANTRVREMLTDVLDRMFLNRSKLMRPLIEEARANHEPAYDGRFVLANNTPGMEIESFNDEHAQSRRDVLAVFRTAQRMLRSRTI